MSAAAPAAEGSAARPPRGTAHLAIENVVRSYGATRVVDDVSLTIEPGEILALLGPSGCGKTTLLKMVAGLVDPDAGEILVDGRSILGTPSHRRGLGMLFQNYALFPHLDVISNVAFGLRMRGLSRRETSERAREALERVRLSGFAGRMPRELSGGQQQRVALARAIVYRPDVLLLDEPLAALDKHLREGLQLELRSLCKEIGLTTILVTHDQDEAMTLADRIAVMRDGRLVQIGRARDVYERPLNRFVAGFVGNSNFFSFTIEGGANGVVHGRSESGARLRAAGALPVGARALVTVRPENVRIAPPTAVTDENAIHGIVSEIRFRGERLTAVLKADDGSEVLVSMPVAPGDGPFSPGERVVASWALDHAVLVDDR